MRVLVLGADGYLGWPTAMRFSSLGHEVAVLDNMVKRRWEQEVGASPLWKVESLETRVQVWQELGKGRMPYYVGDICDYHFIHGVLDEFRPDTIIHYGEQPSAPYSMASRGRCVETQINNVAGTLNLIWAMIDRTPNAHLIKLGSMGEYGTPNIDITEDNIVVELNGRRDEIPYPKQPGSFYHLSKVHDSNNLAFASRIYGLRVTDLNQGVVYGTETQESLLDPRLRTSVHYDHVFGTVINRFCAEAVTSTPLTIYGEGRQQRSFLNIRDTLECVVLAATNPAAQSEFRVMNQFTELFSIGRLAELVAAAASDVLGLDVTVTHVPNPRTEAAEHYYNAQHAKLLQLGLKPRHLTKEVLGYMLKDFSAYADSIDRRVLQPTIRWRANDPVLR